MATGDYRLWIELDVDVPSDDRFAEVAWEWLDGASRFLLPESRDWLAANPNLVQARSDDPDDPFGTPGGAWGTLIVSREREAGPPRSVQRLATPRNWEWLAKSLRQPAWWVNVIVYQLDDDGFVARSCDVQIKSSSRVPGWIRLCATADASSVIDNVEGDEEERRWLDLLRAHADRLNPSYGQIGPMHNLGDTTLEYSLPVEYGRNKPPLTVGESRQLLRGYTWLTIVAEELADRLGGVDALAASGAFHDVVRLAHGGVWLQATGHYRDYHQGAAERVFAVLAPVLRPGTPSPVDDMHDSPKYLVYQDAAAASGQDLRP